MAGLAIALLAALSASAECPERLGSWGYGPTRGVAVANGLAYFGAGTVLRIADPSLQTPLVLGELQLPGIIRGIAVVGTRAYVAAEYAGLRVVNVADPAHPFEEGFFDSDGRARQVAVAGSYAYLADDGRGLSVIDVSDPASPLEAARFDPPGQTIGVAVQGNYAYLAAWWTGLRVVDISNPLAPSEVGFWDTPFDTLGVAVAGTHAYLAAGASGIRVVDVSNPAAPVQVGSLDTPVSAERVAVSGATLFVADRTALLSVGVGNPAAPVLLDTLDVPSFVYDLALAGNAAYLAGVDAGLVLANIANPANLSLGSSSRAWGTASRLAVSGTTVYLGDNGAGVQIIDAADPANPAVLGGYGGGGVYTSAMDLQDEHLFVGYGPAGMGILDITDPGDVKNVGYAVVASAVNVVVQGDHAYVAASIFGLMVVDFSDPTKPKVVATRDTPGEARAVAVHGTHVFVADAGGGLRVFDVANPANPQELDPLEGPGSAKDIVIVDDRAYVAWGTEGLRIVDVGDPATLEVLGTAAITNGCDRVAVAGQHAFVGSSRTLVVVNVADPGSPVEVLTAGLPADAADIAIVDGIAYIALGEAGLGIYDAAECRTTPCSHTTAASATPSSGGAPLEVLFSALATTDCPYDISYDWDFGDGSQHSTLSEVIHLYSAPGSYEWWCWMTIGARRFGRRGTVTVNTGAPEISVLLDGSPLTDGQVTAVAFGTAPVGGAAPQRAFTVRNDGSATLTLGGLQVPAGFVVIEGIPASLAPGQEDPFTVALQTGSPGSPMGQLVLASNDGDENPFDFPLQGAITAPVTPLRFDFGTSSSPVDAGFVRIAEGSTYSAVEGYGWLAGKIASRDRAAGGDLQRDLNFSELATFAVDVPNGGYEVRLLLGDAAAAHEQMGVFLEGVQRDSVTTAKGEVALRVLRVNVWDGQLTLMLDDLGGGDRNVVINALEVLPVLPRRYDFGTASSPVAAGAFAVDEATSYSPAWGYGWVLGEAASRDRSVGGPVERDLNFSNDFTFGVDLPEGIYLVTVTVGDAAAAHDQVALLLEGAPVDTVTTARGETTVRSYQVAVSDGQLTVQLADQGGSDANAVVNGLEVALAWPRCLDFGTMSSPLAPGFTRVSEATWYRPLVGHGWLAGNVASRDRGTGTALQRDLNFSPEAVFAVDVPDGVWDVTLTVGDASAAHDQMGIFLEGAQSDIISTAKGQHSITTHRVAVRDGQLTVGLDDLGGGDANAVINGLCVVEARDWRFDMGTASSPRATGWQRVNETTSYAMESGYGWISGSRDSRDRGVGDALDRDFVFSREASFAVDLHAGVYDVTVRMGDAAGGHDDMGVFLEGIQVASLTAAKGEIVERRFRVAVTDGQLTVGLRDLGGSDANAVLNALEVVRVGWYDFGTASSPVAPGFVGIPASAYSGGLGRGWVSGTVAARDRGAGDDLVRDLNFTRNGTYKVDLPGGSYAVGIIMGDAASAHDQMGLSLEGTTVDTVTTGIGEAAMRRFVVDVFDGALELGLEDLGGSDANAVIGALVITPR